MKLFASFHSIPQYIEGPPNIETKQIILTFKCRQRKLSKIHWALERAQSEREGREDFQREKPVPFITGGKGQNPELPPAEAPGRRLTEKMVSDHRLITYYELTRWHRSSFFASCAPRSSGSISPTRQGRYW